MPTKQETFDTVVAHLRKQGCQAVRGEKIGCAYRGKNGTQCAAGCLIPDDRYSPEIEGESVECSDGSGLSAAGEIIRSLGHDIRLASDFQTTHDLYSVEQWEGRFEKIAKKHDLTYTPPAV